jgi:3-hydroxymyristoyl/3-hydroxydecanoyl-(acyl carrier protein) dehydratase
MASNAIEPTMISTRLGKIGRAGDLLSFDHAFIRNVLPHRGRMQLLDRVDRYSYHRREVVAVKQVAQNDRALEGSGALLPCFPQVLLIEALAQASGFAMNMEHFIRANHFTPERLPEHLDTASTFVLPPMSVLAESKIVHGKRVPPGSEILLETAPILVRSDTWVFKVRASVAETEVARGELIIAYPPYGTRSRPT